MLAEKVAEEAHVVAFAHFSQHPTYGFVHEVVGVVQVYFGIAEAPRRVSLLRCLPSAYHAHTLFPQARTCSQFVEDALFRFSLSEL